MDEETGRPGGSWPEMPIRYEMRAADGTVCSSWLVLPGYGNEPSELWRTDLSTGQVHRMRGRWEEL